MLGTFYDICQGQGGVLMAGTGLNSIYPQFYYYPRESAHLERLQQFRSLCVLPPISPFLQATLPQEPAVVPCLPEAEV